MLVSCWIQDIFHNRAPCTPFYPHHRKSFASIFCNQCEGFATSGHLLSSSKLSSLSLLMHLLIVEVKASFINFWCEVQTQTEWVPDAETITQHLGQRLKNIESPIFELGSFSLKAAYNLFKLHNSNCYCLWTFLPKLTQSFVPGIIREYSSSS